MRDGGHCYVAATDWLGTAAPPPGRQSVDEVLSLLARRYLAGHGPGDARDLARWAGIGLFRPFALVDGRAVATWGLDAGQLTIRPLERIGRADLAALRADALDVLRYLGLAPVPAVVER